MTRTCLSPTQTTRPGAEYPLVLLTCYSWMGSAVAILAITCPPLISVNHAWTIARTALTHPHALSAIRATSIIILYATHVDPTASPALHLPVARCASQDIDWWEWGHRPTASPCPHRSRVSHQPPSMRIHRPSCVNMGVQGVRWRVRVWAALPALWGGTY